MDVKKIYSIIKSVANGKSVKDKFDSAIAGLDIRVSENLIKNFESNHYPDGMVLLSSEGVINEGIVHPYKINRECDKRFNPDKNGGKIVVAGYCECNENNSLASYEGVEDVKCNLPSGNMIWTALHPDYSLYLLMLSQKTREGLDVRSFFPVSFHAERFVGASINLIAGISDPEGKQESKLRKILGDSLAKVNVNNEQCYHGTFVEVKYEIVKP